MSIKKYIDSDYKLIASSDDEISNKKDSNEE